MLGVARRKSLRRKTRIFDQSLHYGIRHVRGGRRRPEIHGLESLEHAPGVGRAASYPATFRLVLYSERYVAHRGQGFHRPRCREVDPAFLQAPPDTCGPPWCGT